MKAIVVHPWMEIMGGGELLCLYSCKALLEAGYSVDLVTKEYEPERAQEVYRMGSVMKECHHIAYPDFVPRIKKLRGIERLFQTRAIRNMLPDADVVFSTQSSVFSHSSPLYHFLYSITDLFRYPIGSTAWVPNLSFRRKKWAYYQTLKLLRKALVKDPHPDFFLALGESVLQALRKAGYGNSRLIYPPCQMDFHPRLKINRIITVSRIIPQKRPEMFLEIAQRLPQYEFMIITRHDPVLEKHNPQYLRKFLGKCPANMKIIFSPIRDCPELLEESKVYLYTGDEPGIGIAFVEGIAAGCLPVAPEIGGGGEVVRATVGDGWTFKNLDQAVWMVDVAMKSNYPPESIRQTALPFSPEVFMGEIRRMAKDGP